MSCKSNYYRMFYMHCDLVQFPIVQNCNAPFDLHETVFVQHTMVLG